MLTGVAQASRQKSYSSNKSLPSLKTIYKSNKNLHFIHKTSNEELQIPFIEDHIFKYNKQFIYSLTLNASIGFFYFGYNTGVLNTLQPTFTKLFNWSHSEAQTYFSIMSAVLIFGSIFTSLFSGSIYNRIGRRYSFILADLLSIIGNGLSMVANEYFIITGRFISGITMGLFSALLPVYINEMVPYEISGPCGAIYDSSFSLGIFASFLFGLNLPDIDDPDAMSSNWWRLMIAFPSILNMINLIMIIFVFKYETPKYLYIAKNDRKETIKSLKCIYADDKPSIEECLKELEFLKEIEAQHTKQFGGGLLGIFKSKYKSRLFIACVVMFAQQCNGIDSILMYSDYIFRNILNGKTGSIILTNIIGLVQVIFSMSSILVLERFGRRQLFILGEILLVIIILNISLFSYLDYEYIVVGLLLCLIMVCSVTLSPLVFIYASDILPSEGIAIAAAMNNFSSYVITQSFLFMKESFLDFAGTMFVYAIFSFVTLVLICLYVKETRNLSPSEIDELFDESNKKKGLIK